MCFFACLFKLEFFKVSLNSSSAHLVYSSQGRAKFGNASVAQLKLELMHLHKYF